MFIPLCFFKLEMDYGFALSQRQKKKNPNQPNQPLVLSSVLCFEFVFLNNQSLGWVFFFLFLSFFILVREGLGFNLPL